MAKYNKLQVIQTFKDTGIVPVFYNADVEVAKNVVKACYEGGIRAFEFTNRGDFAQEVFAEGNVPVCPHLMFPSIADPENPVQDQAAREMGLRLVESCQQVNVYGPVWTEGMWAEIRHAEDLGIPVLTDQKELGRLQQKNTRKKEKPAYER